MSYRLTAYLGPDFAKMYLSALGNQKTDQSGGGILRAAWRLTAAELDLLWQTVDRVDPLTPGAHANDAYEATYQSGSRGVLKPVTGERPGLRAAIDPGTYWRREIAAYRLDQLLEFFLVPTTVSREAKGVFGSMQAFALGGDGGGTSEYSHLERQVMGALDYIAGNTDRNISNWFNSAESYLVV